MSTVASLTVVLQVPVTADHEIPSEVLHQIERSTACFGQRLLDQASRPLTDPASLLVWEQELHAAIPRECIDPVTGEMIRAALRDPDVLMKADGLLEVTSRVQLQNSKQTVTIDLLGGGKVKLKTAYYLRRAPSKRANGARGKSGNGLYPALSVLGIHERLTPAYASLVTREVVKGSLDEAQVSLRTRGVERDRKAIRRVVRIVSTRALAYQKRLMTSGTTPAAPAWNLRGKRIAILVDGGKVRTRRKKQGRRRNSGGKTFAADWKEPRVIAICELDEKGKKQRRGYVRYDATITSADKVFERLAALLRELGAREAEQWVVGGDGAKWIWLDRVAKLVETVGYDPARVVEVVDFYHAVEYLSEFASHRTGWTADERTVWAKRMKRRLKKGNVESIIEEMKPMCIGRHAKKMKKVLRRFETNKERMRYAAFRAAGVPCGSGVVESAVRRIVNLRLKGAGIFWKQATAEGLLHLRARYLSGDWENYMVQIFAPEQWWWLNSAPDAAKQAA
jgi:hypothetical protein